MEWQQQGTVTITKDLWEVSAFNAKRRHGRNKSHVDTSKNVLNANFSTRE
jgi:hypothetical protein